MPGAAGSRLVLKNMLSLVGVSRRDIYYSERHRTKQAFDKKVSIFPKLKM
jgi:hypothetical protein